MSDPIVVYVHGAGRQNYADALKEDYDNALFGQNGPSVVARWAQVFWEKCDTPAVAALEAKIEELAHEQPFTSDDAADLLRAIRAARPPQPRIGAAAGLSDDDVTQEAQELIRLYYEAAASLAGADRLAGRGIPEPVFKWAAGRASADVVPYLYDGWATRMREPVIEVLRKIGKRRPFVILAHSLGSILAYDVITHSDFKDYDASLFVSAGSPLGISNVVKRVRNGDGPGMFPPRTLMWWNFVDDRDRIGTFGRSVKGLYKDRPELREKLRVRNNRKNHHDLVGYLVDPDLRKVAWDALDWEPGDR